MTFDYDQEPQPFYEREQEREERENADIEKGESDKQDSQNLAPSWLNCKYKGYCYYSKCECDL